MNRRSILTGAAASAAGLALTGRVSLAQQAGKVYRVGALFNWKGNPDPVFDTFRKDLAKLGYVEGSNVVFEARFADDQLERFPELAADLIARDVDVIATYGGPATNAARKTTTTIPIVFALVADPVAIGVADTLARPGGNLTGVTNDDPELAGRHIGLLKELNPKLVRVAILSDSDIPGADANGLAPIERTNVAAALAAGLTPQVVKVRGPTPDLDTAFKSMVAERAEALLVLEVPAPIRARKRVVELAAAHKMPTMFWGGERGWDSGGLMSYGTGFTSTYPRMPVYVDRILKGGNPADMAIEVVSRRELVINLKTARELGVTIPAKLLKRADRVVE